MRIFAIALNTFKEAVRDKVLYSLIFFALLMISLGTLLDRITIGQTDKLIKDFGLASISIFGVMIAIFVGIGLVFKEIDKRTIYTIIAKPIHRWQFLIGKYCGLLLTLLVEVLVMAGGLVLMVRLSCTSGCDYSFWKAIVLIYVEISLITAVALLFSSFSTPFLSGIFTLSIYVIGHLTEDLKAFSVRFDEFGQRMVGLVYYVLPNLEWLNVKAMVVHGQPVSVHEILWRMSYGVSYSLGLLLTAMLIFQKREFK